MKQFLIIVFLWFSQIVSSCRNQTINSTKDAIQNPNKTNEVKVDMTKSEGGFYTKEKDILKTYNSWLTYTYNNINLSQDFIGLNLDSDTVNKNNFLQLLSSGKYLPVKIGEKENLPCYKLYTLHNTDKDIQTGVAQIAATELFYYKMEGKELPTYNFEDIRGNTYNKVNTKGKIVVLKCWFIHCVACVKEFPELNKLVDKYKDSKDVLFVSLAMDTKQDLSAFLKTKEFKYAVVPNQEDYMVNRLKVTMFPTHIIIDKGGRIVKAIGNSNDLIFALTKKVEKDKLRTTKVNAAQP